VAGLVATFGSGAMTNSIADLESADVLFVIGSNTTESHPVLALRIRRALERGATLIVADPRRTEIAGLAHFHLQHTPGSDVALLNAMMRVIIDEDLHDREFIESRTEGFEEFRKAVEKIGPEEAEEICGVSAALIAEAAGAYARADRAAILYCMGITQHTTGTDNVMSLANLAMLCGNVGRPGTGVNPLRGQNNVQGACDVAALPNVLPGYAKVGDAAARARFETAWGVTLPADPGMSVLDMAEAALEGRLKALYVMGENPALSDPNLSLCRKALKNVDLLVVQDLFLTETAQYADVVLPAACFAEKDGTVTNTERRVQRVRKAVEPPGEAMPDWKILCYLAEKFGLVWHYTGPEDVFREIATLVPSYAGVTYGRIEKAGLQWPCPDEKHPGTPILHVDGFARGRGRFAPVEFRPPAESPDEEFPLTLTTGRLLYQFHTSTMTMRTGGLRRVAGEPFAMVHPADAKRYGLKKRGKVRLTTRRGSIVAPIRVSEAVREGVVFVPFHYAEAPVNFLTNDARDPVSKIPEYKVCAVRVEPA